MNPNVQNKFDTYPTPIRAKLERLRAMILDVAANTDGVGKLEETLKWGEPAYLTSESNSGTTIRFDWKPKHPNQYVLYLNCQTTLIETYKTLYPELKTEGNRAVVFDVNETLPEDEIRSCISMALTYHQDKRS